MKSIGFQDRAGGAILVYKDSKNPTQKRHDRVREALKGLRHTGNIRVFLIDGKKVRYLFSKGL